jgi:beta-lactamase class D
MRYFLFGWLMMIVCFSQTLHAQKYAEEIQDHSYNHILDSLQIKGSILIYDVKANRYYSNDFSWARKGHLPASTFKIPNTLIALETGILPDENYIFRWDGKKRSLPSWERDLTVKEAFQASCVPCYQQVARTIGFERMSTSINAFGYGEIVISPASLDSFWLRGASNISMFQQIDFLRKFVSQELPISERTATLMRHIMLIEQTDTYSLSAKTGWGTRDGIDNGWYVGIVETSQNTYLFATNVEPVDPAVTTHFAAARISATKAALRKLGISLKP